MRLKVVQKILGLLLAVFSVTQLPPMLIALWTHDGMARAFGTAFVSSTIPGLLMSVPVRNFSRERRFDDGFIVVVSFRAVLGTSGAIPVIIAGVHHMSVAEAIFGSVSALMTTGATVITGIDDLPPSILFYRQLLQGLGGIGIIVLAVAIVPIKMGNRPVDDLIVDAVWGVFATCVAVVLVPMRSLVATASIRSRRFRPSPPV